MGNLVVIGEKKVMTRTEGLGGGFTRTLGEPIDLDNILTGKFLPDFGGSRRLAFPHGHRRVLEQQQGSQEHLVRWGERRISRLVDL